MKSLAKEFNHDFSKGIFELYDKNGNRIYYENSDGSWTKWKHDDNNNIIYHEDSNGFWERYEYDKNDNLIYRINSNKFWIKSEYNDNGYVIYYENSKGHIKDNRSKYKSKTIMVDGIEYELRRK